MGDWLRVVRARNLALAGGGVIAGGWIGLGRMALPATLLWAALAAVGVGAAGNVVNDLFDVAADRANARSGRPIANGRIGSRAAVLLAGGGAGAGLAAAAATGVVALVVAAATLGLLVAYSRLLKPVPLLGNLAVAVIAGLPLAYGALAVGRAAAGVVPWTLAGALHFVREIVKDVEDEAGDRVARRRTLPVVLGARSARVTASVAAVAFIPLSLVLPLRAGYGGAYYLFALPAQMAVLVAAAQLLSGQTSRVPTLLKAAMVAGLIALVTGRVT